MTPSGIFFKLYIFIRLNSGTLVFMTVCLFVVSFQRFSFLAALFGFLLQAISLAAQRKKKENKDKNKIGSRKKGSTELFF
jgi:hypothetical protein